MTRLLSLSPECRKYESTVAFDSIALPGTRITVRRMSLGRRIEFSRAVRELAGRLEFHQSGETTSDRLAAAEAAAEIDVAYLRWGVAAIDGLFIDGRPAGVTSLIEAAPEVLVREIVDRIKAECGLSHNETKN